MIKIHENRKDSFLCGFFMPCFFWLPTGLYIVVLQKTCKSCHCYPW